MNAPFRLRRRAPHQQQPPGTVLWLLFVVMLLAPIGGQVATAQQVDQALAQDGDDSADEDSIATEVPTDDQPSDLVPTEDPALVATEVPTEVPVAEPQTLTITVYRCDHPEYDTGFSENIQTVLTTCTGPGSGTFTVSTASGEQTQSGGSLSFPIVSDLVIQEAVPAGYDHPIANCFLQDVNGNLIDQIGPGEAGSGFWKVGAIGDGDVHCDWYQVDRGVGTVYVVNMACPSTLGAFPLPTMDQLVQQCTEPAGQRQFFVEHGGGLERMGVTGGEFNDVVFEAIKTGPIAIRLQDPTGFDSARVFCQVTTLDGAEISPFAEVAVSGFRASGLNLAHGQRFHCSWFNILEGPGLENPTGDEPPLTTQPPAGAPADLTIQLHTCPAGYDPEAADAEPTTDCPVGPDGVFFTLADEDPTTTDPQVTTGQTGLGAATFAGIAAGDYTVAEAIPADTAAIFVLGCGGGGGVDPIPVFIDGTLPVGIPQGVLLTCHWFHIPGAAAADTVPDASTPISIAALEGTSSITIHAYQCPAGFDVTTVDSNPANACTTPATGISFDLDNDFTDSGGWSTETDAAGIGTVADLPAGAFTIEASIYNGTTAYFVWDCYEANGASTRTDPLSTSRSFTVDLADGAQIRCDWFNVVGGTARVVINSHACGVLIPAYTLTREQLGQQCTEDPGTIDYTVVSHTHQETQPASQNPLQLASFANIPSGYMSVVVDLPDGWATPIVWCQGFTENGDPVSPESQMNVLVGRQVDFLAEPGQVMSCNWYNVIQGFADVQITTYLCPASVDAFTADLTDLVLGCTDDPGTADFTVESQASPYLKTLPVSGGQPVVFPSVPSGGMRLSGKLPDGQGVPVVWCGIDFEDGSNVVPARRMTVGVNATVTEALSAGQTVWCEWFNTQGGMGSVSIWKEACPLGFDAATATLGQLRASCDEDIPDIQFSLQAGSFTGTATSTDLFRYADFMAVPAGPLTVMEAIPLDYGEPVVWCRVQDPSLPVTAPVKVDASGGAIAWDLGPNQWLICEWYNVLDTTSTVTVTKYDCPEGTGYEEDDAWYQTNCTEVMTDIPFTLTHSEGQAMGTTDASGQVQWTDVPLGPFSLQEDIPQGYGDPVVICGLTAFYNGAVYDGFPQRVEATGGYVSSTLEIPNTSYFCFWYNIPAGPGDVTIYKYTCPPGYDVHAWNADPETDCTEGANGITFMADGPDGYTSQSDTGDSIQYAVLFGGLEPGSYTITEVVPDGIAYAFVWNCYGQRMGELRPTPLALGDTLNLEVGAGEEIVCYWYNVLEDPDGTLTVIKYECATKTFVSEIDCEIYEGGQTFDLAWWNGASWDVVDTRTTDAWGRYSWTGLDAGQYWVAEQGRDWCQMTSAQLSADGNWLEVTDGQETVVKVYNCTGQPGKPGKTPTKYPNTGVPAVTREDWRLTA